MLMLVMDRREREEQEKGVKHKISLYPWVLHQTPWEWMLISLPLNKCDGLHYIYILLMLMCGWLRQDFLKILKEYSKIMWKKQLEVACRLYVQIQWLIGTLQIFLVSPQK